MMISNFEILRYRRLSRSEQERRIEYLERTLEELQKYHRTCKPLKRRTVFNLIVLYETFLEKFQ